MVRMLPGWTLVIRSRRLADYEELSSQASQALPWLWRSGGAAEILSDLVEHHMALISCESEEEAHHLAEEVRGRKVMVNIYSPGGDH
jgi:hypothetical protein